jgi:hypothetical protein
VRPVDIAELKLANDAVIKITEPEASHLHREVLRAEAQNFSATTRV